MNRLGTSVPVAPIDLRDCEIAVLFLVVSQVTFFVSGASFAAAKIDVHWVPLPVLAAEEAAFVRRDDYRNIPDWFVDVDFDLWDAGKKNPGAQLLHV
jgi:hypothetical protein